MTIRENTDLQRKYFYSVKISNVITITGPRVVAEDLQEDPGRGWEALEVDREEQPLRPPPPLEEDEANSVTDSLIREHVTCHSCDINC